MARLDKYLWSVRLFKTRSQASDACKKGRVSIHNLTVKPAKEIKVGDIIVIRDKGVLFRYKVLELLQKRVGAKLVEQYMENVTLPEELEKLKIMQLAQKEYRQKGEGRPTKRDRRILDNFKQSWD